MNGPVQLSQPTFDNSPNEGYWKRRRTWTGRRFNRKVRWDLEGDRISVSEEP